jgi:hypothetical protein
VGDAGEHGHGHSREGERHLVQLPRHSCALAKGQRKQNKNLFLFFAATVMGRRAALATLLHILAALQSGAPAGCGPIQRTSHPVRAVGSDAEPVRRNRAAAGTNKRAFGAPAAASRRCSGLRGGMEVPHRGQGDVCPWDVITGPGRFR